MNWYLLIYVLVALLLSIVSGLVEESKPSKNKDETFADEMSITIVWLWPLGLLVGLISFPIWLPVALRNLVWWTKGRIHKKQAISNLMADLKKKSGDSHEEKGT